LACLLHPGALWAANWPSGPTVQRAADGTFDALILRPTALMVLATGAGLFVPAAVVSAPSGKIRFQEALDRFVLRPYDYVFKRPLGDF
jgi:hypothetical protein